MSSMEGCCAPPRLGCLVPPPKEVCQCHATHKELMGRLNAVIGDKWPEALSAGNALEWARSNRPQLVHRFETLEKECDELWRNARALEFKALSTDWGRAMLEIMKSYATHLRQGEAS